MVSAGCVPFRIRFIALKLPRIPKEIVNADAKLKDGVELSVADRPWAPPQWCGVRVRVLVWVAGPRGGVGEAYMGFEGMV